LEKELVEEKAKSAHLEAKQSDWQEKLMALEIEKVRLQAESQNYQRNLIEMGLKFVKCSNPRK
jgi:hypothetical protein